MKFQEMNLIKPLMGAIEKSGYTMPTPIQEATIPIALTGRDILGCAQTGTGKTAAFVLPILQHLTLTKPAKTGTLHRPVRALVLAPTRELAIQNYETFELFSRNLNLSTTAIFGGVNQDKQVQALRRGVDVLVATPGRLNDLIRQKLLTLSDLEIFVLDETDRMLDMGFIHDVRFVISLLPVKRQTMLFSATMPKEVEELALSLLTDPATVKVDPVTSTVDKIEQTVYFVPKESKKDVLRYLLLERGVSTAIVFTRTKSNADQVVRLLKRDKIDALAIHGDKSQNARQKALNAFKSGEISVLVATDIAARGIDIVELPFVVNYNIPEEAETYIHRIGRTGRAGLGGSAISICCSEELEDWRAIEKLTGQKVPEGECPWSVTDMQPTAKPKKQPYVRPQKAAAAAGEGKRRAPATHRAATAAKEAPAGERRPAEKRSEGHFASQSGASSANRRRRSRRSSAAKNGKGGYFR